MSMVQGGGLLYKSGRWMLDSLSRLVKIIIRSDHETVAPSVRGDSRPAYAVDVAK